MSEQWTGNTAFVPDFDRGCMTALLSIGEVPMYRLDFYAMRQYALYNILGGNATRPRIVSDSQVIQMAVQTLVMHYGGPGALDNMLVEIAFKGWPTSFLETYFQSLRGYLQLDQMVTQIIMTSMPEDRRGEWITAVIMLARANYAGYHKALLPPDTKEDTR